MPLGLDQRRSRGGLLAFAVTLAAVALVAIAPGLRSHDAFLPHAYCYKWDPALIRLHLVSDVLIGTAYVAIPLVLVHFIRKREDLPFNWMFLLFGLFIVACGATHWMEVWTLWNPNYWLAGTIKAVTAAASVPTAILLYLLVPHALAIPSTRQLRETKDALEREVEARRQAQAQLEEAHRLLEDRVAARTRELQDAHRKLQGQHALLEEATREKNHFLAVLSHELRNPLHAVAGGVQVLRMAKDEAMRRRAEQSIERQVGRLGALLEDLLDVARATRELVIRPRSIELRQPVEGAIETTEAYFNERSQRVELAYPPERVMVHADAGRLEQVVSNLLHNASRHSPAGATVRVEVEVAEDMACVAVIDRGEGLTPAQLATIFDFFGQAPDRPEGPGLGIGLNIVKQIVVAHGGTVHAASAGVGLGSRFTVRIPLARA